jgi:hypothetical protein
MEIVERKETKTKGKGIIRKTADSVKSLFTKRRKFVILTGMFLLLCVTGYLNFALNNNNPSQVGGEVQTNVFTAFRNTRADERARDIMIYENMIGNSNYSQESQANAETKLFEIRANVAFETTAEGLVLAENYADVIVNRSNGFVNVLIKKDSNISQVQAAKIMTILQSVQPDLDIDSVFISIME